MKSILATGFAAFLATVASAQTAPKLLPFQGRLTDQNGGMVSNGVRLMQFKIFDVPSGGSPKWAGELHRTTINGGLVNVLLGSKTPFTGVDFDQQLYLEITVDVSGPNGTNDNAITAADPPMLPRQVILPAVFAKESAQSRDSALLAGRDWSALLTGNDPLTGIIKEQKLPAGIAVPVGAVMMWWGSAANIPANFEICDGLAPITAGATLTGNKPDLRDRFPKGAVAGVTNVKSSPVAGGTNTIGQRLTGGTNLTIAQMPSHNHSISDPGHWHDETGYRGFNASGNSGGQMYATPPADRRTSTNTTGITIQSTGGGQAHDHTIPSHDNRPAFLEMFFIIRVK